ncbi:MAG: hypothetical protein V4662_20710 [Verrucomicrobiota bacterium]
MVTLEKPIQRGWMRCYFLTAAARERSDARVLEDILKEINVIQYHWKHSFTPTKRNRRAKIQQLHQPLKRIKPWSRRQSDLPHEWKNYFNIEAVFQDTQWKHTWYFRWPQLFELRVVPRMVYKLPVCDPAADSRLSEIDAIFDNPRHAGRLAKLQGLRRWQSENLRQRLLERLGKQRVHAALNGDLEAEKIAFASCYPFCLHLPHAPVAQS